MRGWIALALCVVAGLAHAEPQMWRARLRAYGRSNGAVLRLEVTPNTAGCCGTSCFASGTVACTSDADCAPDACIVDATAGSSLAGRYRCIAGSLPCLGRRGTVSGDVDGGGGVAAAIVTRRANCHLRGKMDGNQEIVGTYRCIARGSPIGRFTAHRVR